MPIWGLDKEGEVRGAWRELDVPNLYYMMGECRVFGEGSVIKYYLKVPFIYLDIIPNILHYVSETDDIHRETKSIFLVSRNQGEGRRNIWCSPCGSGTIEIHKDEIRM